jgi:hypothetical protein
MTTLDIRPVGDLIKAVGPTEDQRRIFNQSFPGTLLGQAILLVTTGTLYFAAIVLFNRYGIEEVRGLREAWGETKFWIAISAPFVCIILFQFLPTFFRARREAHLRSTIIGGDLQFKAGYFRLYPYGQSDRDTFKRLDSSEAMILNWLLSAEAPVLYLSGASGVGKSSVLAASVLPKLRDAGWSVAEARLFGDPMRQLSAAVLAVDGMGGREPADDVPLRDLLEATSKTLGANSKGSLLLVVDQFEEFLILHQPEVQAPFVGFLKDVVKTPLRTFFCYSFSAATTDPSYSSSNCPHLSLEKTGKS